MDIPTVNNYALPDKPSSYAFPEQSLFDTGDMPKDGDVQQWIEDTFAKYGFSVDEDGQLKGDTAKSGDAAMKTLEGMRGYFEKLLGPEQTDALFDQIEQYMDNDMLKAYTMTPPTEATGRPDGDNRSADQIIADDPALAKLGHQKDIQIDKLKERCGDWTSDNPDPESRADAAYNMSQVLNYIDTSLNRDGGYRGPGDGNIEGLTDSEDARHGTEAGILKDFGDEGYSALPTDHRLDETDDSYVNLDGSNQDNFEKFINDAGSFFGPLLQMFSFLPGVGMLGMGLSSLGSSSPYGSGGASTYGSYGSGDPYSYGTYDSGSSSDAPGATPRSGSSSISLL